MSIFQAFHYCPRCKSTVTAKENYITCSACGFKLFDNPRPTTALLLQNEADEYLLFTRADEPNVGLLDLPGGFVADHESLEAGARRELKEEIGIDVGALTYFGAYPDTYLCKEVAYDILGVVFTGRINGSKVLTPNEELLGYKFLKLADIPMAELAFPSLRQIFLDLQKRSTKAGLNPTHV